MTWTGYKNGKPNPMQQVQHASLVDTTKTTGMNSPAKSTNVRLTSSRNFSKELLGTQTWHLFVFQRAEDKGPPCWI